jgi:hypothetical protein
MTLTPPWRKLVLLLHVTSSVGFLGAVAAFLALAVTGAIGEPALALAAYRSMRVITWQVIVPLALATLLIGIVQSLATPWGLFRYYWVIVKLVLTLIAVAVLMLQTQTVDALSKAAGAGDLSGLSAAQFSMTLHGAGGLIVLAIANVLSIYKPKGVTRFNTL